jgi:hypothetical protein
MKWKRLYLTLFVLDLTAVAIIAAHDSTKYRYKRADPPTCYLHKTQMITEVMPTRYGRLRLKYIDFVIASNNYFPNYNYYSYLGCVVKGPIRDVKRDWYCEQCRIAFCNWAGQR